MTDEQKLWRFIDQALAKSKDPDPHTIARKLLPRLSALQREEALMKVLVEVVTERIRFERSTQRGGGHPGPSRWSIATRLCVGGEWKFRSDCTADDLFTLADEYAARGNQLLRVGDEYRALGEQVRAAGCATLGELEARDLAAAA